MNKRFVKSRYRDAKARLLPNDRGWVIVISVDGMSEPFEIGFGTSAWRAWAHAANRMRA